jgi:hypothetical protein
VAGAGAEAQDRIARDFARTMNELWA